MKDGSDGTATDAIEIVGLDKVYGQGAGAFRALTGIDLTIRSGEFFTLLGPSGCGKTTLLRVIAGFENPTEGSVRISGEEVAHLGPNKRQVNTVFQNYALFPHMTVAQNIGFGLRMLGRSRTEVAATTAEMLRLVRMEELAQRRPAELSGGQQQRVALARALAPHPRVLLLDEPLSALDLKLRKEMQGELKRLQAETGITFVFVTHDQEEALTMSDRIAVMSAGRILQRGTPHEIYHAPTERFVADFIGDTNFLTVPVVSVEAGAAQVELPGGRTAPARLPEGARPAPGAKVTVVIRPEQARLVPPGEGEMQGEVTSSVFFGTDTHVHARLTDGQDFVLRRQNAGELADPSPGDRIGLALGDGVLRVLKD
ncbi:ABC transporter ATP-binding protein [Wenxinia marina]|uniref:Spermidine/putrescine import ATP-binding protein PotA n=1 Tax=Wenxinia marina DSM 24838 TaxID=1123501 RepID=A0A0D0Q128_9RHOB|nr:ABC transporter ATP-binding protein [Wenxinia marina]KIQ68249.1 spermidine/putrescine ABC transporter ATP-binding subunit [Wenxinia marina DSM 24838]GGL77081.1 spermidine/putrescine import ATP-binding protein PotA [Wenxinia marina]